MLGAAAAGGPSILINDHQGIHYPSGNEGVCMQRKSKNNDPEVEKRQSMTNQKSYGRGFLF